MQTTYYSYLLETVENIKKQVNLVDFIGGDVGDLKKVSRYSTTYKGLCPFHKEKTPSFVVFMNPDEESFYCFGCKEGGDIFRYVLLKEAGLVRNFHEAVDFICKKVGITFSPPADSSYTKNSVTLEDKKLLSRLANFFAETLETEDSSRIDLTRKFLYSTKGLDEQIVKKFKIGYCESGWLKSTMHYVNSEQKILGLQQLEKLGLLTRSGHFLLENRLVFPITNHKGEIVSLAGRVLPVDNIEPKYLNGGNSPIFKKSETLFGLGEKDTRESIVKTKEIFVVEGYFDVIKLHQNGIYNVVACMGTALTDEHFKLLNQFKVKTLHLCMDSDKAGSNSVEKIIEERVICDNPESIDIRIMVLPDGKDPDDLTLEQWGEISSNSKSVIDYITQKFISEVNNTLVNLNEFLGKIFRLVANLTNPVNRDFYLVKLAKKLGVNKSSITRQYNEYISGNNITQAKNKLEILDRKQLTKSFIYSEFAIKLLSLVVRYGVTSLDLKEIKSKDGSSLSSSDFRGQPRFIRETFLIVQELSRTQKGFTQEDLTACGLEERKIEMLLSKTTDNIFTGTTGLINQLQFLYNKMKVIQIEQIRANLVQSISEIDDDSEIDDLLEIVEQLSQILPELDA